MNNNPWERRKTLFASAPSKSAVKKQKPILKFLLILWMAFKKTSMLVGAFFILSAILMSWTLAPVIEKVEMKLPKRMVLYMELDGDLNELPQSASFVDPFASQGTVLKSFIDSIYMAKDDPRVKGIYAKVKGGRYAVSHVQELRQAIHDFRKSGKFAYIYAPSYDGGLGGYYLASAFDERWMQPMGNVMISGMNVEMPFLREVLDKIGVTPQFFQRKEYKSAYENLTHSKITEANQRALKALIGDISGEVSTDIEADLSLNSGVLKTLVDKGLFIDEEALREKLVDHVEYEDVLWNKINERVTGDEASEEQFYVNIHDYMTAQQGHGGLSAFQGFSDHKPNVALIYVVGAIMDSDTHASTPSSFVDDGVAAADDISDALLDAADNDSIEAVVLRVDSPGGSPVASETILRAVQKVRDNGKPVIVSMGTAAASGGYWVSAYADYIFASPTTITGSIGVLGGKISAKDLWDKIGVNWDGVQWGQNANMFSMNVPFSKSGTERMNAMLDNVYVNFVKRVSEGRDMSAEEVEKIARGRVWSGKSAKEIGLVDALGGLNDAFDYVAKELGYDARDDLNVVILPKPLTPIEQFVALLEGQVRAGQIMGAQASVLSYLKPYITQMSVMEKPQNAVVYNPLEIK